MVMYKKPKNDEKYVWTNHSIDKMAYYRISESLVKRTVRFPKRVETGVAPNTIACMQPTGSKKRSSEVWVMYRPAPDVDASLRKQRQVLEGTLPKARDVKDKFNVGIETKKLIISAWRYPGVSKVGGPIPIPEEILGELETLT